VADVVPPSSTLAFVTLMSEKLKSGSPSEIQVKNRRKTITMEGKLDVIRRIAGICHNVRPACSSIRTYVQFVIMLIELTLWPCSWTFAVQHTIYVKCEYFTNQEG